MSNKAETMKEKGKRTLTPKLRFPEFRDEPGWDALKLGEVASFHKGQGLPKSAIAPGGKYPCIHYGQLFTEYSEVIDSIISRTDSEINGLRSQVNDILMPTSDVTPNGLAKASCIKIGEVILGGDILAIRTNVKRVEGEFLARQIRQRERQVLQLVSGSTVFHLYASSLDKLAVSLPSPSEQQKLAECLSSLDGLIAAEGRMLEALNAHKKGLMQQLFPQPGQTQPRLRFPEFLQSGAWGARKLKKVAPLQRGFDLPSSEIREGTVPIVYSNGIRGKHAIGMATAPGLVTGRSGTIGKLHYIESGDYWPHNTALWVTDFCGNLPKFIYYLYDAIGLERFSSGSGVPTLNRNDVHGFEFAVPKRIKEQQCIADCLTALDTRIAAQAAKIDALKQHKRGLMQQLFPAPEATEL